jgi:hypothetical protein
MALNKKEQVIQKSLVSLGFTVSRIHPKTKDLEDISIQFADVRGKRVYNASEYIPITQRRAKSEELFANNKVSDEYYTRGETWERFLKEYGLVGTTVFEPFCADGSSKKALEGLVDVKSRQGANFWDIYEDPEFADLLVLSNPPFSFKWLIIQTLLEKKRDFALILPWQSFIDREEEGRKYWECPLKKYKRRWGGDYIVFKLTNKEKKFWKPTTLNGKEDEGEWKEIGCSILYWRKDGVFNKV